MRKTSVLIRALDETISIPIETEKSARQISSHIQKKWQNIMNATAGILDVPAALIMRVTKEHMQVYKASQTEENPYLEKFKDALGHGLYCETVIGEDRMLHVQNALKEAVWAKNPDVKLNMIAYIGLPIKWPDGRFFGTICALDNKERQFTDKHIALLEQFKSAIETDLVNIKLMQKLNNMARIDSLTGCDNRLNILDKLELTTHIYHRNKEPFCLVMIDIDKFKQINDTLGHQAGDKILKQFANHFNDRLRKSDSFGRFGGDEFIAILRNTTLQNADYVMQNMLEIIAGDPKLKRHNLSFTYGIVEMNETIKKVEQMIDAAYKKMLRKKGVKI